MNPFYLWLRQCATKPTNARRSGLSHTTLLTVCTSRNTTRLMLTHMKTTSGLASVTDPLEFRNRLAFTAFLTVTNRMRWPPRFCLTLPSRLRSLMDPTRVVSEFVEPAPLEATTPIISFCELYTVFVEVPPPGMHVDPVVSVYFARG